MPTVVIDGEPRIALDKAKEILVGAMPVEGGLDIYMRLLPDGSPDWDGPFERVLNPAARRGEAFMQADFPDLFAELGIVPRMIRRPTWKDFGPAKDLADYSITKEEFVRLAECYGVKVVEGEVPVNGDQLLEQSPDQPQETKTERCQRLLREYEAAGGPEQRGALARVVARDGRKRQTVREDINFAIKLRDQEDGSKPSTWFPKPR